MNKLVPVNNTGVVTQSFIEQSQYIAETPTLLYLSSLKSPASVRTMSSTLRSFAQFLGYVGKHAHIEIDWSEVNAVLVDAFIRQLDDKDVGKSRQQTYLTAIKQSAENANLLDLMPDKTLTLIKRVKAGGIERVTRGRPLSTHMIRDALYVENIGWKAIRDNAMLSLLFGCGLRRSELIKLTMGSLQFVNGKKQLRVIGKRNKERCIFIPPSSDVYVNAWLDIREKANQGSEMFFVRFSRGNKMTSHPIKSANSIYKLIQERCEKNHLVKFSPHDCRRSTATILYQADVPIDVIKDILGHNSIATTERYIFKDEQVYSDAADKIVY